LVVFLVTRTTVAEQSRQEHRQRSTQLLFFSAKNEHGITNATSKRRVILTRIYANAVYRRDQDNLVGGMKPVIDAMRRQKLLVDDTPDDIEAYYRQEYMKGETPGVQIELFELS
jgi:Holliday junction resolvase RusA-like endonuclease